MKAKTIINIFGDTCPTPDTLNLFRNGDAEGLLNDVLETLSPSDIVIANLECALTDAPKAIRKAGPVLHAPTDCANVLKKVGVNVVSLANNHIRDCGDDGVQATIKACDDRGMQTLGAGKDIDEARKPLIIERNGYKVGIISFAEHEFNIAECGKWGANCFDPYTDLERIATLRRATDCVIVLYHGGIEYYPLPSPELREKCQAMVRFGATLVTCQHSHCVGTVETYMGGYIVYGQGNSVFGYRKDDDSWNTGLLLRLSIEEDALPQLSWIGMEMTEHGVCRKEPMQLQAVLDERSSHLNDQTYLNAEWRKFCKKLEPIDIPLLLGWTIWLIRANRILVNLLSKIFFSIRSRNVIHNMIRCDAHREVVCTLLKETDYN